MNFMTYDRNKFGEKLPQKTERDKNGIIIDQGKYPFHKKDAGYEEDLLHNQTFEKKSLLTTQNMGLFEKQILGLKNE